MPKCYLGPVNSLYAPEIDYIIAPWCLKYPSVADLDKCIEIFPRQNILIEHNKCRQYAEYLLIDDVKKQNSEDQNRYYLYFKPFYYYLTFFLWSRFCLVQQFASMHSHEGIEYQRYSYKPVIDTTNDLVLNFIGNAAFNGWLCQKVLDNIGINIKYFEEPLVCNVNFVKQDTNKIGLKTKLLNLINRKFNMFGRIRAFNLYFGLTISIIFLGIQFFLNLFKKKNTCSKPKIFSDKIIPQNQDFNKIFSEIKDELIVQVNKLYGITDNKKLFDLSFCYPSEISKDSQRILLVNSYLSGRSEYLVQHGALYGTWLNHFRSHDLEYDFSGFIAWGNNNQVVRRKITRLPSPWINIIANKYKHLGQSNVLWITSVHYKAGDGLEYLAGHEVVRYIHNKEIFYHNLNQLIKEKVLYKPLHINRKVNEFASLEFYDSILDYIPNDKIKDKDSMFDLCQDSKLVFVDYYGTPFYECMSMNVPVILCFAECKPFFNSDAQAIFEKLKQARIVHDNSIDAANFLSEIYNYVESWWKSAQVQNLRKEFLDNYVYLGNYKLEWTKMVFSKLLKGEEHDYTRKDCNN